MYLVKKREVLFQVKKVQGRSQAAMLQPRCCHWELKSIERLQLICSTNHRVSEAGEGSYPVRSNKKAQRTWGKKKTRANKKLEMDEIVDI
jgi:hypothetical protein